MSEVQFYSNKGFNRAIELREVHTPSAEISYIPIFKGKFFITTAIGSKEIVKHIPLELSSLSDRKYFLGLLKEKEIWCIDLSAIEFSTVCKFLPDCQWSNVRACFPFINEKEAALLAYAQGLSTWNKTHQFCGSCGSKTMIEEKGHQRKCVNTRCNAFHFPRIDPAVIVLIEYESEDSPPLCLLNMHKIEKGYRCSLFSGFSEIGESLEDTVRREMKEEINVAVHNIKYIASQPWPFPATIMFGFSAKTKSKAFKVDNQEIKEAQWFSAAEIKALVDQKKLIISSEDSISNYLIKSWIKENN
ncbi:MAG: NAD(+) diphosphatase [Aureispira sp.]